ncbi:MAG: tetratricopeptide repeat protein [Cyanobacteria bacterium J06581_3]
MRSGVLLSLSLLLGTTLAQSVITPADAQTADALRRVGYDAEFASEPDIAEDMWQQLIQLEPEVAGYYASLGYARLYQEKWSEAETAFQAGIDLPAFESFPNPESLYLGLGRALRAQGKFAEAKTALQAAASANERSPFGYRALGRFHRDYGELEEAAAAFSAIIQQAPVGPYGAEAYWDLGKTLVAQGNLPDAELAYRRAIGLNSEDVRFWQSLAAVLNQQGGSSELAGIASNINRLKDKDAETAAVLEMQNPLAEEYAIARYQTQAAETQQIVNRYPETVSAYIDLGNALRKIGQFAAAESAFRQATLLNPDNAMAQYNLGEALNDLGRNDEAEVAYQTAQRLYPNISSPGLFLEIASNPDILYQFSGLIGASRPDPVESPSALARTANAEAESLESPLLTARRLPTAPRRRSLPTFRTTPRYRSLRAPSVVLPRPSTSTARPLPDLLLDRLQLNPDNAVLQGELGERFYRQDDFDAAATAYRQMAELDPRYAHLAYHNLAIALRQQEQLDLAKAALRQAIAAADNLPTASLEDENTLAQIALTYHVLGDVLTEQAAWAEVAELYEVAMARSLPVTGYQPATYWDAKRREALLFTARTSLAQDDPNSAETAYRALMQAHSETGPLFTTHYASPNYQIADELATLLFNQGELQAAEAVYKNAMAESPITAQQLYRGLATVLRAQNRTQDADALVASFQLALTAVRRPLPPLPLQPLPPLPLPSRLPSAIARPSITQPLPSSYPRPLNIPNPSAPARGFRDPTYILPLGLAYYHFGQNRLAEGRYGYAAFALDKAFTYSTFYVDALIATGLAATYSGGNADNFYAQALAADAESIKCYIVPPEIVDSPWQPEDYLQTGEACLLLLLD